MDKKIITVAIAALMATACSSVTDRRTVNDADLYASSQNLPKLVIPQGLNEPTYNNEYAIPTVKSSQDARVGNQIDIRPPMLVLATAEGTRVVDEASDNVKVLVETLPGQQTIGSEVYDSLMEFLNKQGIMTTTADQQAGVIETDWIVSSDVVETSWFSGDTVNSIKQRFSFNIDIRPHGRSGEVTISLIDFEQDISGEVVDVLTDVDKRRYAIDMLNDAIAFISAKRSYEQRQARIANSRGIEISQNEQAHSWQAKATFNRSWARLGMILPELGFEIEDRDRNEGVLYARFKDNSSFWTGWFADKPLDIDEDLYRFNLVDEGEQTKVEVYDEANEPLSSEDAAKVYQALSVVLQADRKVK
ncbi:outer membrane protein assembly factor BamC [Paraferrimonas sp. SM1919]|uniref:outer membrane protein assembly factor BamC n=1 Tax=Paraferrimonas sp. SM1919 TaxID=2662263 RepID=UPI0013D8453D|nr:outer membrane protein assembly factor BamC [Paraferrimonas sp. SM1919]